MADSGYTLMYGQYPAKLNYPVFTSKEVMLARHLTPEIYEKLYKKVTPNGVTLDKCIQVGVERVEGAILGLLAGDEESYDVFSEIFNPIIDEKHLGFGPDDKQPPPELDATNIINGQLDEKYVKSCRIRTGRSIKGLNFSPTICRAERRDVERIMTTALASLNGEFKGTYFSLAKMDDEMKTRLIADRLLFSKPDGHLIRNATTVRDWPDARGVWLNEARNFFVWVNEKDHCRLFCTQQGGDIRAAFDRFCRGVKAVTLGMKSLGQRFVYDERLGNISASPTNIGTGLRCSVMIQLRKLSHHRLWQQIPKVLKLQASASTSERLPVVEDLYEISNSARLKNTEREFVQLVIDGARQLIKWEQMLEQGQSIDAELAALGVK